MSDVVFDGYWPFEAGPGASSSQVRWRQMARLWSSSGVVRRHLSQLPGEDTFVLWNWDRDGSATGTPYLASIAAGACWVNGHFGIKRGGTHLLCPGTGLVVLRLDPVEQAIALVFRPGVGPGGELEIAGGLWETPVAYLDDAAGTITDLRRWVPTDQQAPPIQEIPPWVPRGAVVSRLGPGTAVVAAQGITNVHVGYYYDEPLGRRCRYTASARWQWTGSNANSPVFNLDFYVRDTRGQRRRQRMWAWHTYNYGLAEIPFMWHTSATTSFTVDDRGPETVAVIEANLGLSAQWSFDPNSCRIDCEDVGG